MRIAITGADGFTGRYLCEALAARGVDTVALTADITDADAIDAEVLATPFDQVIHLAAQAFVGTQDWMGFYRINQIGTYHLLDAVARHRPNTRCLLASSAQIYGPQASGIVSETAIPSPSNPYAVSKYAMELGALTWADRLPIMIMRPFNYTGVGQDDLYLIPKIVAHFRRRADRIELGNLDVQRDFGDVRSVASAYCGLALDCTATTIVNICSGKLWGLKDIVATASRIAGHHLNVAVNPAFVRKNDVAVLGGNSQKLHALLPAWSPIPLENTLQWMLEAPAAG